MKEEECCSFCGKPRMSALHLFVGPAGCNICDSCVSNAAGMGVVVPKGIKCGFCGRKAGEVPIVLTSGNAAICRYCIENCHDQLSEQVGGKSEFLATQLSDGASEAVTEFKDLARIFAGHFDWFTEAFASGQMDWGAHNDMAQLLHPMRSKAGRIGDEQLLDILWQISQLLNVVHFDDVESNNTTVAQLTEQVDNLLAAIKRLTK